MTYSVTIFLSRYLLTGTASMKAAAAIAAIISRVNRVLFVYILMVRQGVRVCVHISVSIHRGNSLVDHPQEIECAQN